MLVKFQCPKCYVLSDSELIEVVPNETEIKRLQDELNEYNKYVKANSYMFYNSDYATLIFEKINVITNNRNIRCSICGYLKAFKVNIDENST